MLKIRLTANYEFITIDNSMLQSLHRLRNLPETPDRDACRCVVAIFDILAGSKRIASLIPGRQHEIGQPPFPESESRPSFTIVNSVAGPGSGATRAKPVLGHGRCIIL